MSDNMIRCWQKLFFCNSARDPIARSTSPLAMPTSNSEGRRNTERMGALGASLCRLSTIRGKKKDSLFPRAKERMVFGFDFGSKAGAKVIFRSTRERISRAADASASAARSRFDSRGGLDEEGIGKTGAQFV